MHFLQVKDTVNMIHGIIRTANPFPYSAKLMFVSVRNKLNKSDVER